VTRRAPKAKAADRWGWRSEYFKALLGAGEDTVQRLRDVLLLIRIQILFRERAGLKFRSWSILRGAEAPIITAAQLVERGFEGTVEVLGEFDDAPNQSQGLGLEVGEKGGGEAAMRVVGGPAGDAVKAAAYVDEVVNKHKKRLTLISSLGDVDLQSALLLLTYCAVPRLHFLLQMVPYDLAQDGFRESYNDILNACRLITDISEEEFAKPLVAGRVALPWRWGVKPSLTLRLSQTQHSSAVGLHALPSSPTPRRLCTTSAKKRAAWAHDGGTYSRRGNACWHLEMKRSSGKRCLQV
jgi:hypothetical protein